jgi:death on curing protein
MWRFLTFEDVLDIHGDSLKAYGGTVGLRDRGMVESALGSAQNAFFYANGDVFDIAAAYAFHLAESQAFLDGNKRTGIGSAIVFLHLNGVSKLPTADEKSVLYDAMIAIATHELDKPGLATLLRKMFAA